MKAKKGILNGLYTIGLLTDWFEDTYHITVIKGINDGVLDFNMNLLSFVGGAFKSPRAFERSRNVIYDYANEKSVDGLIILTGSFGLYCTLDDLNEYFSQIKNIPIISIAQKIDNAYSILVDNRKGLRDIILHLINDHKYRDIAIVNGPINNKEANDRFDIYKTTLVECGIKLRDEFILTGNFNAESGYKAVSLFLDKNRIRPQAIVAANDDMALGVMNALFERKINIPTEIAVVGFDDQITSAFLNPPLTTVRQPLYKQGYLAVQSLFEISNGKEVPEVILLPTEPVIRESCGCLMNYEIRYNVNCKSVYELKESDDMIKPEFIKNIKMRALIDDDKIPLEKIEIILRVFHESLVKNDLKIILKKIEQLLISTTDIDELDREINTVLSILRKEIKINDGYFIKDKIDDMIFAIRQFIIFYSKKKTNYNKIKEEKSIIFFRDFSEELTTCNSIDGIINLLVKEFNNFKIGSCYFSLYEHKEDGDKSIYMSHLLLAFNNKNRLDLDVRNSYFPSDQLIPDGLIEVKERWSLLVEPILFSNIHLGIVLFDDDRDNISFTFGLLRRMFLFNALRNTIYMQKILSQSSIMEKANNEISKNLETLRETQDMLIQSEKMSALGGLVAGISHEINTPLGISVTASSHLEKIINEICSLFNEQKMKKSDFEKFISTSLEASGMIQTNIKRAYDLIKSFKQIAVDQSSEEKRKFNVREYIEQVLLSLKPTLKKTDHDIHINCPTSLVIYSYPGEISQILTNFIINSLIHAYDKNDKGKIIIDVSEENGNIKLIYSDDGKGVDPSNINKIYEPFFTTKRGQGGTGLGLNIVYNIVNQSLKGTIKCESMLGKGTRFTIIFPFQDQY